MTIEQALRLAVDHHRADRFAEAEALYRQVLAARPDHPTALHLLGLLAHQVGRHADACTLIERAIAVQPGVADYHFHLAEARFAAGAHDAAEAAYRRALQLQPDHAAAHNALGHLLFTRQRVDEALAHFARAVELAPDFAQAQCNLGTALMVQSRYADAVAPLRRAVELDPEHAVAHVNLSMALQSLHRVDEAADVLERAVPLMPAPALNGLGLLRMEQGRLDDALACFRRSIALDPADADAHSNLLFTLNYAENVSRDEFFAEHLRWAEKFEKPLAAQRRAHDNDRSPDRRLRVGYVSPDFRQHPVGFFIAPGIVGHRRDRFEVFCYSEIDGGDDLTRRLREAADAWRVTAGLDDGRVAEMVRADGIDVLVDLAGHTARNRLRAFARKPAPVQVTYLGYSATTGMRAMDYQLGDAYLTPPGMHEAHATETIVRLPRAYVCYTPPARLAPVGPPPAESAGHVTFGSLNRLSKVTPRAFEAWAEIVRRTPNARLLLHADAGRHLDAVRARWEALGLEPGRLEIVHRIPLEQYFALFGRIDIALDPFPHNGGKTTHDALIMGVPVVTLCGDLPISRAGFSTLASLGLHDLVAYSPEEYATTATALAADLPRVAALRRTLRERMLAAPLTDAAAYVSDLEDAYRAMWREWCARTAPPL